MNIQIFGTPKCQETKKAVRYFKERRINFQQINLLEKEISKKEFESILNAVGEIENLINKNSKDYSSVTYLVEEEIPSKVKSNPSLLKTPIVRNGTLATAGYEPNIWKTWE